MNKCWRVICLHPGMSAQSSFNALGKPPANTATAIKMQIPPPRHRIVLNILTIVSPVAVHVLTIKRTRKFAVRNSIDKEFFSLRIPMLASHENTINVNVVSKIFPTFSCWPPLQACVNFYFMNIHLTLSNCHHRDRM
jgi:hypothetical protein